jgi:hypothetical protein
MSDIFKNMSDVFKNMSDVFKNMSDVFQNMSDVFQNMSDVFQNMSDVFQDMSCTSVREHNKEDKTPCRAMTCLLTRLAARFQRRDSSCSTQHTRARRQRWQRQRWRVRAGKIDILRPVQGLTRSDLLTMQRALEA